MGVVFINRNAMLMVEVQNVFCVLCSDGLLLLALVVMGSCYNRLSKFGEAEAAAKEAYEIFSRVLPAEHASIGEGEDDTLVCCVYNACVADDV